MSAASSSIYSGGVVNLEELAEKYQKLLQEYSRTKAQHSVLKKAVFEEKNKKETCLKELNDREQKLRKLEQEIDVLSFHNKGLIKRVEVLQNGSSKFSNLGWGGSKSKKGSEEAQVQLEAAIMDLQNKITENETLHRELEETRTERSSSMEDIVRRNQELETEKKKLVEELQVSKDIHATSLATTLGQKEKLESEVQGAMFALEKLQNDCPVPLEDMKLLDELYKELLHYHKMTRTSYLLLNTDMGSPLYNSELPFKIIKELIDGTSLTDADHGIEQLISSLKGIQEAFEKRVTYLSEKSRRPELIHAGTKLRESFRKLDRSLCRIKRALLVIDGENFETWLDASTPQFQSFRGVQELRSSCDELFGASAECVGLGVSLLSPSAENSSLIGGLQELMGILRQCATQVKSKITPGASASEFVTSLEQLHVTSRTVLEAFQTNLSNDISSDDWLFKALNTQLIGFSVHTRNTLDKLFGVIRRWMMLFAIVDTTTKHAAGEAASIMGIDLTKRRTKYLQSLRREYPPTSIPYSQSLDLLAATMSGEKAKSELQARLDSERERSKKLEILLNTFQEKIEASDSNINQLNYQLKALNDSNLTLQESIAAKDTLISQLELQINEQSIRKKASQNDLNESHLSIVTPNGHTLKEVTPEAEEADPLSPVVPSMTPNFPSNIGEKNVNFLKYLSDEEHYVQKVFKNQHETKLKDLAHQIEIADSQSKRFHDAWLEVSDQLSESRTENEALKQQLAFLAEELAKTKDDSLSLESNYKQQITYLTERFAELVPRDLNQRP